MAALAWLPILAPLVLLAVAVTAGRDPADAMAVCARARAAAAAALAVAVATLATVIAAGPLTTATIGVAGAGLSLHVDTVSAIMLTLVAFVGLVVVVYSRNYLKGDGGQTRFMAWMAATLAAVLTLTIAGNMLLFALAWIATSLALHRLLVYYADRPKALLAARKKAIASRLGDASLIVAMVLVFQVFGTLDFATIFAAAEAMDPAAGVPAPILWTGFFLVLSALLKSAQFPFHGWLTEVMETPTPVSALLHAGIINAGGFLIIRFSEVVQLSVAALDVLALVAGFTALFGSIVMLTATSIKVQLATSTVAQMGFMLLQCGLGAFSAALVHIVAHSLYKAHAFLSSGSVVDIARSAWSPGPATPSVGRLALALAASVALVAVVATGFGASPVAAPGVFTLAAVLVMGLTLLFANTLREGAKPFVLARAAGLAVVVTVAYYGLQLGAEWLLAGAVPPYEPVRGPVDLAIIGLVIVSFAAVTLFQARLAAGTASPAGKALWVHLANGLYANALFDRIVRSVWPVATRPRHAVLPPDATAGAAKGA